MSQPDPRVRQRQVPPSRLRRSLLRYRVMAYVTGTFLLLLCVEMVAKYLLRDGEPWLGDWIAIWHGWIYVVYLVTVLDLWSSLRWAFPRLVALVLAGVVPGLSFVVEHRVTAEIVASGATVGADQPGASEVRR